MGIKAVLKPDHIPVNKYTLSVVAVIPITVTSISEIESEIDNVNLPDRTKATGGNKKAISFTIMTPLHHTAEYLALEAWMAEAVDAVSSTYKKPATLTLQSNTGAITRTYMIEGMFITKRKLPKLEMENEGEIALVEWECQADDIVFLP
jgi:hypothetical protein